MLCIASIVVHELERQRPDGPPTVRPWPSFYGPNEQSVMDWFNFVTDQQERDRPCLFVGHFLYHCQVQSLRNPQVQARTKLLQEEEEPRPQLILRPNF